MRRDPRVTLLCYDPRRPLRYLEVRGTVVEMTEDGAAQAPRRARLEVRRPAGPVLRRRHPDALRRDRDPGPVPDPADPRRRARCHGGRGGGAMTTVSGVAPGRRPDPGLAPRPADPADLRRPHDDGHRRPAPVEPRLGRRTTASAPGSTRRSSARRAETCSPARRSACSSSTPTTPPGSSRSAATWSSISDGAVEHLDELTRKYTRHPALLRMHLPGRAAVPRDTGHLPDPRATDHARRDP